MPNPSQIPVGWIGLGAMGSGMAASLVQQGYPVKAYDVWKPSVDTVVAAGATAAATPAEAAEGVQVLGLMVVNAAQVEDILFGVGEVANVLKPGSSIICFSTVPPSFLTSVQKRLEALGIGLCDSPVSGGSTRAASGTLTVMTSGTNASIETARPVLEALTRKPEGNLSVVGGSCGDASNFKLINQVFCAGHIASASESMAFGAKLGLNPRMLYNIIRTAAGDSFMFGHRVPWQLRHDGVPKSAMSIIAKDSGIVNDEARLMGFPAPMSSAAEQIFISAMGAGMAREDDGLLIKQYQRWGAPEVAETGTEEEEAEKAKELSVSPSGPPKKVLFVGLGAMGRPMALSIQKAGIKVAGFDVSKDAADAYKQAGGEISSDIATGAKDADIVVLVPNTASQAEEILTGTENNGICSVLPNDAVIIICSTIAPSSAVQLQQVLDKVGKGHRLVDAPISGGPSRAETGDLAIMASGSPEALSKAHAVLQALSAQAGNTVNLHFIREYSINLKSRYQPSADIAAGGVGSGNKVKAVNQLLACIHLAVAAEALAFAVKKGMNLDAVMSVILSGAAYSYVAKDRVPRMRMANSPVFSATDTLVKDLGIVLAEAKKSNLPLFLGQAAYQQLIATQASGLGREDDSTIGRLWEKYGIRIRAES